MASPGESAQAKIAYVRHKGAKEGLIAERRDVQIKGVRCGVAENAPSISLVAGSINLDFTMLVDQVENGIDGHVYSIGGTQMNDVLGFLPTRRPGYAGIWLPESMEKQSGGLGAVLWSTGNSKNRMQGSR